MSLSVSSSIAWSLLMARLKQYNLQPGLSKAQQTNDSIPVTTKRERSSMLACRWACDCPRFSNSDAPSKTSRISYTQILIIVSFWLEKMRPVRSCFEVGAKMSKRILLKTILVQQRTANQLFLFTLIRCINFTKLMIGTGSWRYVEHKVVRRNGQFKVNLKCSENTFIHLNGKDINICSNCISGWVFSQ